MKSSTPSSRKHRIELVLIAIPAATGLQMKQILERCTAAAVPYKTVPGLAELIEGGGLARQIRDVAVEDLLGRIPVNLDLAQISARIEGRVVMVTGAAGSIGSELCRQMARFRPRRHRRIRNRRIAPVSSGNPALRAPFPMSASMPRSAAFRTPRV